MIVEDHELTRFGLKTAFESCDFVEEIHEAESAEVGIDIVDKKQIDLVIMDLGLPGIDGIEATQRIKQYNKDVKIVILTSHNDSQEVLNSLKAGANAYCSKEINPLRLTQVVQSVLDGASWFDPSISHIVLEAAAKSQQSQDKKPERDYGLTSRETQILKLITEGYSNNEIANQLFVSINTTKAHVASILQKLEVDDRLQAALKALKERLV
ncbi:MAG: response regulator transcription factor [Candidatus Gastranaerophilales bacterium]|nr:response regulator transcription factor [Candidatus Gastranaerophilales bacterium]